MMAAMRRSSLVFSVVMVTLAAFMAIWLCPYLKIFGHEKLCIGLYLLLVIVYFYGRDSGVRRAGRPARSR